MMVGRRQFLQTTMGAISGMAMPSVCHAAKTESDDTTVLSAGLHAVYKRTNGFRNSGLIVVETNLSAQKTCVCEIVEWAGNAEKVTMLFSLDQSKQELSEHLLCRRANLCIATMRSGMLEPSEKLALVKAASELSRMPLFIDDTPIRTVAQIRTITPHLKAQNSLELVIIDDLQMIESEFRDGNWESNLLRGLKEIAEENNLTVVALKSLCF